MPQYGAAMIGQKLRVAVLGTGSLGKEHVRIYSELAKRDSVQFSGIYDLATDTARKVADKYQVTCFASIDEAAEASDALSVVTPTTTHYEIGRKLLELRKHVLVEKPMSDKAAHAADLVELAQRHNLVLQVGHVERFNPIFKYLEQVATD